MPDPGSLRQKYPLMKYNPDPGCKFCGGTGEREVKGTSLLTEGATCCICLFVGGGHKEREEIAEVLGRTARRIWEGNDGTD